MQTVASTSNISVIIPTYNGTRFIRATLESVLAQTLPAKEIIVVDDGSTDQTVALVQALAAQYAQIKLIQRPNGGVCAARNTGISQSKGELIALLDQDDVWLPHYLQKMTVKFKPDEIATANYQKIDEYGRVSGEYKRVRADEVRLPGILTSTHIFLSGSIFSRQLWQQVGPFDEALVGAGAEDWDWFLRAVLVGAKIKLVGGLLWQYRVHSGSSSFSIKLMADNTERVLNKVFADAALSNSLQAQRPHAYYINYVIAAGKFYAFNEHSSARTYLERARTSAPSEFLSLQTFISFLKIYAQIGGQNLIETGEKAIEFVSASGQDRAEQKLLKALGYLVLTLLTARHFSYAAHFFIQALKFRPTLLLYPGVYRVLFSYSYTYCHEALNRLRLTLTYAK